MRISKYNRYWAVHDKTGSLVCLTVYKKGANEVVRRLTQPRKSRKKGHEENRPANTRPSGSVSGRRTS